MYLLSILQGVKQRTRSQIARVPDCRYVITRRVAAKTTLSSSLWAVNVSAQLTRLVYCSTQGPGTRDASIMEVKAAPRAKKPSQLGKVQGLRRMALTSSMTSSSLSAVVRDMHLCSLGVGLYPSHAPDGRLSTCMTCTLYEVT